MLTSNVHVTNVAPGPVVTGAGVNALKADGTKFGISDKLIATGMTVQRSAHLIPQNSNNNKTFCRCVELILIGVSNQQKEVCTLMF